jgi:ribosomal protein S18 acetylase RimI-like enzyme
MSSLAPPSGRTWISEIRIRLIQEIDLPALEWEGEYTHFRRLYRDAYRRHVQGLSLLWVAELPPQGLIGQVFIQLQCDRPELCNGIDRAYLYSFRVRPTFRNYGIGSKIMDVVEEDLRLREFRWVTLNVARDNLGAQRLYQRRGYRIVAPEPGRWSFIDDQGRVQEVVEPAWRMEKRLA